MRFFIVSTKLYGINSGFSILIMVGMKIALSYSVKFKFY